jgi:hypothetical protein
MDVKKGMVSATRQRGGRSPRSIAIKGWMYLIVMGLKGSGNNKSNRGRATHAIITLHMFFLSVNIAGIT